MGQFLADGCQVNRRRADSQQHFVIGRNGLFDFGELQSFGRTIDDGFHLPDLRERARKVSYGASRIYPCGSDVVGHLVG